MDERLEGGQDTGAIRVDGSVRRPVRALTRSVHDLLQHLDQVGFQGVPKVLGIDEQGREMLTHLQGQTVGNSRPWPSPCVSG